MHYLFDTNVISDSRRPERTNDHFRGFIAAIAPEDFGVSVVTILEIEFGILRQERRDANFARLLREWLEALVLPLLDNRVIDVTLPIARRCATLPTPNRAPTNDALIAATALELKLPVVTRNIGDFAPFGVEIIDPWDVARPGSLLL